MTNNRSIRVFEDVEAVRARVPLFVGIMGPSGSGKTYSALRLAEGIQRVTGGDIHFIDTEARRALHYASRFKFRHVAFGAPFGPLDYLDAIEHSVRRGAGVIVIDSMSHEHEGPGGVLEMHEAETERLAKAWKVSHDVAKMSAWGQPKRERRKLINALLQMPVNFVFCFRAKPKLHIEPGKKPEPRGFMPIAGDEFVFEMTVNALLLPNSGGVPTWQSRKVGESMMIKLPEQFQKLLLEWRGPLNEDLGEQLAVWASGATGPATPDDYKIPESVSRKLGGKHLRQFSPDELSWLVNDAKSPLPPEVKQACRLALEYRAHLAAARQASASTFDDEPAADEPREDEAPSDAASEPAA